MRQELFLIGRDDAAVSELAKGLAGWKGVCRRRVGFFLLIDRFLVALATIRPSLRRLYAMIQAHERPEWSGCKPGGMTRSRRW